MREPKWYMYFLMIPWMVIRSPYVVIESIKFIKDVGGYLLKRK